MKILAINSFWQMVLVCPKLFGSMSDWYPFDIYASDGYHFDGARLFMLSGSHVQVIIHFLPSPYRISIWSDFITEVLASCLNVCIIYSQFYKIISGMTVVFKIYALFVIEMQTVLFFFHGMILLVLLPTWSEELIKYIFS